MEERGRHRRKGDRHGSGGMRGRRSTSVVIDGRMNSKDGRKAFLFFLLILLC